MRPATTSCRWTWARKTTATNRARGNRTGIGASILRKEDLRFLAGRGTYVADIERPGMTFGVFVRLPHAHARIKDAGSFILLPGPSQSPFVEPSRWRFPSTPTAIGVLTPPRR